MPLKIVRNDITKMDCEAIVNTANEHPTVGTGCDYAVYKAAGYDELLAYREKIGFVKKGDVFLTPGFRLKAKYIIHAVSPLYINGKKKEENKLRSCYRKSLKLAAECGVKTLAFPLISTGGFGYPKEEGMRIAVDEINAFLLKNEMTVYLVVFDSISAMLGAKIYPDLKSYIDQNYVNFRKREEYEDCCYENVQAAERAPVSLRNEMRIPKYPGGVTKERETEESLSTRIMDSFMEESEADEPLTDRVNSCIDSDDADAFNFFDEHESALAERMEHISDTFSQYLLYLISAKGMTNAEVYKRAIVDKKVFSKIKNNPQAHPRKMTAMCLCVGARLNMDETKDLLARAGYALSPCDKTDIIFSYFIEHHIYDMIELDIQLEEHGLPCLIS